MVFFSTYFFLLFHAFDFCQKREYNHQNEPENILFWDILNYSFKHRALYCPIWLGSMYTRARWEFKNLRFAFWHNFFNVFFIINNIYNSRFMIWALLHLQILIFALSMFYNVNLACFILICLSAFILEIPIQIWSSLMGY